jgi:hypothetical protein
MQPDQSWPFESTDAPQYCEEDKAQMARDHEIGKQGIYHGDPIKDDMRTAAKNLLKYT